MDEQFSTNPPEETTPQAETDMMEETAEPEELTETETEETAEEEAEEEAAEEDPLATAFQYDTVEPKKNRWPIVLLAVLLVVVFVGGLLWAFGVFDAKEPENPDGESTGETGGAFGTADVSDLTAAQSANLSVSNGMFAFNMESLYLNMQSQYGSYLSMLGLDTTVSTKEQTAYSGTGSWFDYFKSSTKSEVEWMLVMAEAAKANGITVDKATQEWIDEYITAGDFSVFHNGVSAQDGRAFLEMYYAAVAQETALYNAMTFTDDEVTAHYNENKADFDQCSYVYFAFSIGESGDFATADDAADAVAKLTACKDADAFKAAVVAYLMTTGDYETEEAAGKAYDSACVQTGVTYSADDELSEWLFADDTAVGAIKKMENESTVAVYMLTAAPARDTTKTVNVRHILLTADTYGSDDAAKAKADAVLAEWKAGDATAASFGELAAQYTEDSNGSSGGLYTGVTEGYMVTEFNDWCFDEDRKVGDTDVVKTSYGYHVMYFEGTQEAWYGAAKSALQNSRYTEQYTALAAKYPVTFHDDAIDQNDM